MKRQSVLPGIVLPESALNRPPAESAGEEDEAERPEEAWPPISRMMGSLLMLELEKSRETLLPPVVVIGLGLGCAPLNGECLDVLNQAEALAGGRRQLEAFSGHPAEKIVLGADIGAAVSAIEARRHTGRRVVVLAGGDPLFFGIGAVLAARLGASTVKIYPALSCLQEAAARLALPWAGIRPVSLHGRGDMRELTRAVLEGGPVCVLTDAARGPDFIARYLLDRGVDWLVMHIFENLGAAGERHRRMALPEAAEAVFHPENTVILQVDGRPRRPFLGIADGELAVEGGLLTKGPVRAAALSMLRISPEHTVWDIGAGSGAVAVEAAALAARGQVFAVEKHPSRIMCVEENRRRFGAVNVEVVAGAAPQCLGGLPDPDRIFLGGGLRAGGGRLLAEAARRLRPGGRLLVSCVLQKSLHLALDTFRELELKFELSCVQAAMSAPLADDVYLAAANPVFLIMAEK